MSSTIETAPSAAPEVAAVPAASTIEEAKPAGESQPASQTAPVAAAALAVEVVAASESESALAEPQQNEEEAKEQAEEAPEPQNPLTEKFTEAEWTALKAFRKGLPDIFRDSFPDDAQASEQPIALWGVQIDPRYPKSDARVSVILMKFLRARNLNINEAREMLVNTLRWRKSFDIDAVLKEEFPEDIFGSVGHIFGKDKEGRPVIYNIYGGNQDLKAVFGDVQRFIRWRVALMEKTVELLDFSSTDQTVQIHDYAGVSLTSRDANSKAAASESTSIFQSHYPELLYKKFFVNVPTLLTWIFWAFKPLISANTLAKMSVVGSGAHTIKKSLSLVIDLKELPERYGGEAKAF